MRPVTVWQARRGDGPANLWPTPRISWDGPIHLLEALARLSFLACVAVGAGHGYGLAGLAGIFGGLIAGALLGALLAGPPLLFLALTGVGGGGSSTTGSALRTPAAGRSAAPGR